MKLWKLIAGATLYTAATEALIRSRTPYSAPKRHFVAAEDGQRLALDEYVPAGKEQGTVYLQHGLGSRANTFDLHPHGPSLARWLASRGWHVYLGSMRGRETGDKFDWKFSDYLFFDVPALTGAVKSLCGESFHWVGHSLGGILGLAHAARSGGKEIASITTIASALHYGVGGSTFNGTNETEGVHAILEGRKKVWNKLYHRLVAPWAATGLMPGKSIYNRKNMSQDALLAFHGHTMADMTVPELMELASTFDGEGILCDGIEERLPVLAKDLPVPWLCIAGSADRQCPPETIRWTYDRLSPPQKRWHLAKGYGHVDLVCGERASTEVWSKIDEFIRPKAA